MAQWQFTDKIKKIFEPWFNSGQQRSLEEFRDGIKVVTDDLQNQVDTVSGGLAGHLADPTDAHDASAISNVPAGTIIAVDIQAAINELDTDIQGHITDSLGAHAASAVSYTPTGGLAATELQGAVDELESEKVAFTRLDDADGSTLVGFIQSGAGASPRTAQAKMRDIFHADDRGLVGDGVTDETTALQNLFDAAAGKVLMLGVGKTYGINSATGLTIPANTTLIANGSKFKRLQAKAGAVVDADYNITIGNDCEIDRFELDCIGGSGDIGGVLVSGSRVNIGTLKVTAPSAGSGSLGNTWNAARIGPNSGTATDVHIGRVDATNWDRPVVVQNITRGSIGFIHVDTYRRGLYIKDCKSFSAHGGHVHGLSPNSTGVAGDNGVLIEAATADWSCEDIRIDNFKIDQPGEHGARIGGQFNARGVWFRDCKVTAAGSGTAATGGSGFKALGPTSVFGRRHEDIHIVNCSNWNSVLTFFGGNFAGIHLGKVFGAEVTNFVCGKTPDNLGGYAETGNSCYDGIRIIGCQKVAITNPQIQRPQNSGIFIYDFTDGVNDWGQTDDIDIVGGHVNTPGVAGVEIDCSVITMRRITISGPLQVAGGQYTMRVTKGGTGAFISCYAAMRSLSPSVESFNGLGTDWMIAAQGTEVGASACVNGSTWQSSTAGTLRVRKAGAWASL